MPDIITSKVVHASVADVWNSWDQFGDISDFHPGLDNSYLLANSANTGLGASRQCDFVGGKNFIHEEIVEYVHEQKLTIKIYDGNIPLKVAHVTFAFEALSPTQTRITTTADFKVKFGLLGRLLRPIMRKQLSEGLDALLDGNAAFVERQAS